MSTKKSEDASTELDTFLPNGEAPIIVTLKNTEKSNDADFDPLQARHLDHPVSNSGTLMHLLKSSLGTGILSMPAAFKASGLVLGILVTLIVSIICTHCAYVLVKCAHVLYKKAGKTSMNFADVAKEACLRGPPWAHKFGPLARDVVQWGTFITYFASCSCYVVIIAENFYYVAHSHLGEFDKRIIMGLLLLPFILIAFVPNLKYLAPCSMVANVCMAVGLGITFYYLTQETPPPADPADAPKPAELFVGLTELPVAISVVIFAIEAIGVVMPLENNMQHPKKFVGICGVLNQGTAIVTFIYITLGFMGYLKYGGGTADSITLNLPREQIAAQAVNVLIGISVFFTYGLVFYVCIDIAWSEVKGRFTKTKKLANYVLRSGLVLASVLIAVAVPQIVPFVGLIGAFCFSILGLLIPVFVEVLTYWDDGFGYMNWKILKHVIVFITGLLALVFGSKAAIVEILKS